MQDASPMPCKNEQEQREITKNCECPSEAIVSKECPKRLSRQLICYCDGSYSCETQIGYSGFRTSNGFSKYCRCPYGGSTESEVFAACLALQYTAKYQYDTLTLYTDNSKVKQILTQPKGKDHNNYPTLFKALRQCHKGSEQFRIRVEHVRGHPTWYEQQQCPIKREFAKVDRQVRRRRQQYEHIYNFPTQFNDQSHMTYSYWCDGRYIRLIHPKKFSATVIITTS
jgi:ribonuclease HI